MGRFCTSWENSRVKSMLRQGLMHRSKSTAIRSPRRRVAASIPGLSGRAVWRAQQASKLPTIGLLSASTPSGWSHWTAVFVQRLRELGWVEGRTVAIEYRWAEGHKGEEPGDVVSF